MKNGHKLLFIIIFVFLFFLNSCDEYGGTIVISNNYSENITTTVYSEFTIMSNTIFGLVFSYKDKYGPKNITAKSSEKFNVDTNSRYGIVWKHNGNDKYKTVNVEKGQTVEVNIP